MLPPCLTGWTDGDTRCRSARNQSVICLLPGLMAALITAVAPETSNTRNRSLPARLIPPIRCLPPVERSFGVRPAQAARWRPDSLARYTPKHWPWIGLLVTSRPAPVRRSSRVVRQAIGDALPPKHHYPSGSSRILIV